MVLGLDLVGSILVGASVLVIGYLLNGYLQRKLEKRTTNYHAKLEAFQGVNKAAAGLIGALIGMRNLFSMRWEDRATEENIFEVAGLMALAREAERPLETGVVESVSQDMKEASLEENDAKRKKVLSDWAEATYASLLFLYTRVLAFHLDALTLQLSQADIVSDNVDVETSLDAFRSKAVQYLEYLTDNAGKGPPTVEELGREVAVLDEEWGRLKDAMWAELDATL